MKLILKKIILAATLLVCLVVSQNLVVIALENNYLSSQSNISAIDDNLRSYLEENIPTETVCIDSRVLKNSTQISNVNPLDKTNIDNKTNCTVYTFEQEKTLKYYTVIDFSFSKK